MFTKSAKIYDAIYSFINYEEESNYLHKIIEENKQSKGCSLLDVACGTAQHISYLKKYYQIEGLDLESEMLKIASLRNPEIKFNHADMSDFDLKKQFDVIICMFSSIGFLKTIDKLESAAQCFAKHLVAGGLLVVEPWVQPDAFIDGHIGAVFVNQTNLKISRINSSKVEGKISKLNLHYLVGENAKVDHYTEDHELGLFTNEEYLNAFSKAGLISRYEREGPKTQELYNRGLYLCLKPL